MTGWSLTLLAGSTVNPISWGVQSDLTGATARKISVYLDQPHQIEFSMNAAHPEALLIDELFCDVVASYDSGAGPVALVRGRVGPSGDTGDGTSVTSTWSAHSYKDLLNRKILYDGDSVLTYASVTPRTAEQIAWQLVSAAQGRTNGTLGITQGVPAATSSTTFLLPLEAGMVVGEQINQLAEQGDGLDWDIDPALVYLTYYPQRGRTSGLFPLDYGGSVSAFTRTLDPSGYANAVRVSGGTPSGGSPPTPSTSISAEVTAGTAVQGRWERQHSDQDLLSSATVLGRALKLIADAQIIQPTYTMTLKPGMWRGPDDLWLGDIAPVYIDAGRLQVDTQLRVVSMSCTLGEDGDDTVSVSLGGLSRIDAYYARQRKQLQDIARLERR